MIAQIVRALFPGKVVRNFGKTVEVLTRPTNVKTHLTIMIKGRNLRFVRRIETKRIKDLKTILKQYGFRIRTTNPL